MTARTALPLLLAAVSGMLLASLGRVAAEPQPAWDRDLTRQLLQTQERQQGALEAMARAQEQQARALQELVRATERMADTCSR